VTVLIATPGKWRGSNRFDIDAPADVSLFN
jgi:hypothetical protein